MLRYAHFHEYATQTVYTPLSHITHKLSFHDECWVCCVWERVDISSLLIFTPHTHIIYIMKRLLLYEYHLQCIVHIHWRTVIVTNYHTWNALCTSAYNIWCQANHIIFSTIHYVHFVRFTHTYTKAHQLKWGYALNLNISVGAAQ